MYDCIFLMYTQMYIMHHINDVEDWFADEESNYLEHSNNSLGMKQRRWDNQGRALFKERSNQNIYKPKHVSKLYM